MGVTTLVTVLTPLVILCTDIQCVLYLICITEYSHIGQMSTFVDPRILTKVVFDFPERYGIKPYTSVRNMFRPLVKAAQVLNGFDLECKIAIVTGANSGLGVFSGVINIHVRTNTKYVHL